MKKIAALAFIAVSVMATAVNATSSNWAQPTTNGFGGLTNPMNGTVEVDMGGGTGVGSPNAIVQGTGYDIKIGNPQGMKCNAGTLYELCASK